MKQLFLFNTKTNINQTEVSVKQAELVFVSLLPVLIKKHLSRFGNRCFPYKAIVMVMS